MPKLVECDVELEISLPQIQDLFKNIKIIVDDGVRTPIETKGHGLQRSMILTILRVYAEHLKRIKGVEKVTEKSTIFAIEEPEL